MTARKRLIRAMLHYFIEFLYLPDSRTAGVQYYFIEYTFDVYKTLKYTCVKIRIDGIR